MEASEMAQDMHRLAVGEPPKSEADALRALHEVVDEMVFQARTGPTVDWRPNTYAFAKRLRAGLTALTRPAQATEAGSTGADDRLWALHIEGPDDVLPAPSRELAQQAADLFNATFPKSDDPNWLRVHAVVIEWPHGIASHALEASRFVANWITPTTIRGSATPTQDAAHGGRDDG